MAGVPYFTREKICTLFDRESYLTKSTSNYVDGSGVYSVFRAVCTFTKAAPANSTQAKPAATIPMIRSAPV
jgi:hypothetical protein